MAAERVLKSTYMDDSMDSVVDESQGINLYEELNQPGPRQGCKLISGYQIRPRFSKGYL